MTGSPSKYFFYLYEIYSCGRDCPLELQEAIASIIFASPRCSDLPELMQIRNLFTVKYGKEFVSGASELRPDSNVNRLVCTVCACYVCVHVHVCLLRVVFFLVWQVLCVLFTWNAEV